MHLKNIATDLRVLYLTFTDKQTSLCDRSAFLVLNVVSLLYNAAFCCAIGVALETALNGQHSFAEPGGLPQIAIAFTSIYLLSSIISIPLHIRHGYNNDELYKNKFGRFIMFLANIGMVGMIGSAVWALVEHCKSASHMPSALLNIAEKTKLSSEQICYVGTGIIVSLFALWSMITVATEFLIDDGINWHISIKEDARFIVPCLEV